MHLYIYAPTPIAAFQKTRLLVEFVVACLTSNRMLRRLDTKWGSIAIAKIKCNWDIVIRQTSLRKVVFVGNDVPLTILFRSRELNKWASTRLIDTCACRNKEGWKTVVIYRPEVALKRSAILRDGVHSYLKLVGITELNLKKSMIDEYLMKEGINCDCRTQGYSSQRKREIVAGILSKAKRLIIIWACPNSCEPETTNSILVTGRRPSETIHGQDGSSLIIESSSLFESYIELGTSFEEVLSVDEEEQEEEGRY